MKFFFFIFLLLPLATLCQDNSVGKFSFGYNVSPDYCFRKLVFDENNPRSGKFLDQVERPAPGFTTGLNAKYRLRNYVGLECGLLFSDKSYQAKPFGIQREGFKFVTMPGDPVPKKFGYSYNHYFFEIPLKANFYVSTGRIAFYVSTGISTNFYLSSKYAYRIEYANGESKHDSSLQKYAYFRKVNFSLLTAFGWEIKLTKKTSMRLEPTYRISLRNLTDNDGLRYYLYSFGGNCGIYFIL
jgi:hypothetical protein